MHPLPNELSVRDVSQWLNNAWFVHNDEPMEFRGADTTDGGILVHGRTLANIPMSAYANEVMIHWPHCGSVNVANRFAVYAYRLPAKIYSRSYTPELIRVMVPMRWGLQRFFINDPDMIRETQEIGGHSRSLIARLFSPSYVPYQEALAILNDGLRPTVAISSTVILGKEDDCINVYYRGKQVGSLIEGRLRYEDLEPIVERKLRKMLEG